MRKLYILVMLSSLLFMSMTCDKALDDEERYSFDENGTPSYKWITSISKEKFSEYVVGNGWRMAYSEGVVMKSQDETQQSSSSLFCPTTCIFPLIPFSSSNMNRRGIGFK